MLKQKSIRCTFYHPYSIDQLIILKVCDSYSLKGVFITIYEEPLRWHFKLQLYGETVESNIAIIAL